MTFKSNTDEEDTTHTMLLINGQDSLVSILQGYEERYKRIAKSIVSARKLKPIETSKTLAEIEKTVPVFYRFGRIHPATRTFQAIRIAVNDELNALQEGLKKVFKF